MPTAVSTTWLHAMVAACGMILLIVVCTRIYSNGLDGPLILDDQSQIGATLQLDTSPQKLSGLIFSGYGPSGRPVSMATFVFNGIASGNDLSRFKETNLALHLLTALLLFWLTAQLLAEKHSVPSTGQWLTAGAASSMWALHPIQVSTVLYTVQRMTQLSAFFVVAGLLVYCHGRKRQIRFANGRVSLALAWGLFWPLAFFSKENGVLFPLYVLLLELFFLRFQGLGLDTGQGRRLLALMISAAVVLSSAITMVNFHDWVLAGYQLKSFTLLERLMTEPRILVAYIAMLIFPTPFTMGFVHDDFTLSKGLLTPWTTLPAILLITALAWLTLRLRFINPLAGFGIGLFLCGHALEAGIFPLDLMYEHRNYLPAFGAMLVVIALLNVLVRNRPLRATILGAWLMVLCAATHGRAHAWGSSAGVLSEALRAHPQSELLATILARELTAAGRYGEASSLLLGFSSQGAELQRLSINCGALGSIQDRQLMAIPNQLTKPLNNHAIMELEQIANDGLDNRCEFNRHLFLNVLDRAIQENRNFESTVANLKIYKAHYQNLVGDLNSAISTLQEVHRSSELGPVPLLLAAHWLAAAGDSKGAVESYRRAVIVAQASPHDYSVMLDDTRAALMNEFGSGVVDLH